MAKIHDWNRLYWRNASGSREFFDGEEIQDGLDALSDEQEEQLEEVVDEADRCVYINDHEDTVSYRVAEEDEEGEPVNGGKYEVTFNGELIEDVTIDGWADYMAPEEPPEDEEDAEEFSDDVDVAAFGTRGDARRFASEYRKQHGSPEQLGYEVEEEGPSAEDVDADHDREELMDMEYPEVVELAKEQGIKGNQSHEDLADQLSGEAEPELREAPA